MANSLTAAYVDNLAKMALPILKQSLLPLSVFTTDYSSDAKEQGDTVKVTLMPSANTINDLQGGLSGDRESGATDTALTSIDVKLDRQPISVWAISDEEIALIAAGNYAGIKAEQMATEINNLGNNIADQVTALITNANFNSPAHKVTTVANWDLDAVVDTRVTLANANWFTGATKVSMVLNSDYHGALSKDRAIQDISASGIDVVKTGIVEKVDRFPLVEYPNLGAQSESLAGFAAKPSAIAIAMRPSIPQSPGRLDAFQIVREPQTGAVISIRSWYDQNKGKQFTSVETLLGYAVGRSTELMRLTTA